MATEVLLALVRANIAAAAAILVVLLLRRPAGRLFGPEAAYVLWLCAPAAMFGAVFALTTQAHPRHAAKALNQSAKVWLAAPDHANDLLALWLVGVVAAAGLVLWNQLRFLAAMWAGRAGPAVLGVVHTRLVVPDDFAERFTEEERKLVRAHERAHVDRRDTRANALLVLVQCLCWFNPLLHVGARALRLDQELACDAAVIARRPRDRRRYAETLLKTQLMRTVTAPLGCHWAAPGLQSAGGADRHADPALAPPGAAGCRRGTAGRTGVGPLLRRLGSPAGAAAVGRGRHHPADDPAARSGLGVGDDRRLRLPLARPQSRDRHARYRRQPDDPRAGRRWPGLVGMEARRCRVARLDSERAALCRHLPRRLSGP
jgi:beta-lactamase regulating signal transducer with metallopeptidase domain